ncbi:MAG: NuoM family protein [Saprospiraceae bacterium]
MSLLLIPLLGALLILAFVRGEAARPLSLLAAIANLGLTIAYLFWYNPSDPYLMLADFSWIPQAGIRFKLGVDGTGLAMLLLTNLLTPLIIGSTYSRKLPGVFYGLVLLMQAALVGVFTALDGIVFYVFWELALLPIYFICAVWGGEDRIQITLKFFIYTFIGSLFMLLGLIYLQQHAPGQTFDWADLMKADLSPVASTWLTLAFFLAFAIKMPVFPFHTWQPDTYVNAPTGGAMLLSGIMLKMGIYGVIRWMLPLQAGAEQWYPVFIGLAIIGIIYGSLIAIRLQDIKRIIAYASIAHVGLIAAGVFAGNETALQGAILQMLNNGINIVGLFFVSDIIENRTKSRQLNELGGIAKQAPVFAALFMIIMLGTVAVPLTNGFAGELLLLKGLYEYHIWAAATAGLTLILCAVYMLRIYQFAMFGPAKALTEGFRDVRGSELIVLGVIATLVIVLGVYPQPVLDLTKAATGLLLEMK